MAGPVDLAALVGEPEGEPFTFTWDGHVYELPPDVDIRAAAALQAGRVEEGLRIMLGAEQFDHLEKAPSTFSGRHLQALLESYAAHLGTELGESVASIASPPSTAKRSRPTSSASTGSRSRHSAAAS